MRLKNFSVVFQNYMIKSFLLPTIFILILSSAIVSGVKVYNLKNLNQKKLILTANHIEENIKKQTLKLDMLSKNITKPDYKLPEINQNISGYQNLYLLKSENDNFPYLKKNKLKQIFKYVQGLNYNPKEIFITPEYYSSSKNMSFSIVKKLDNDRILFGEIPIKLFENTILTLQNDFNEKELYILNQNSQIISSGTLNKPNKKFSENLLNILKNQQEFSKIQFVSGDIIITNSVPINLTSWSILCQQKAFPVFHDILTNLFLSAAAATLFFYFAVFFFNKKIKNEFLKPLNALINNKENEVNSNTDLADLPSTNIREIADIELLFYDLKNKINTQSSALIQTDTILEHTDFVTTFKDCNLKYISASKTFLEITGYSSIEDIKGLTDKEVFNGIVPSKQIEDYMANDKKAMLLNEGDCLTVEEEFTTNNNTKIFLTKKFPVYKNTDSKELTGVGTITSEITQLKISQQLLKSNEELYRGVVEDTPILICRFLPDGKIIFANKTYSKYFNKTYEETLQTTFLNLIPECDREKVIQSIQSLTPENPTHTHEHKVIDAHGNIKWQKWTNRAIFDDSENITAYQSIGEDITQRKLSEEAIASEKERLAVTLRSIGDGVITTDMLGKVVLLNKVAEKLTGWSQQDAKGKDLADVFNIIDQKTGKACENPVEKVINSGEIVELSNHTVLITKDNKQLMIADSGAPIKNSASQTIGVVLVFRDVTEKHKLQETIQRAAKLESLGTLAGGIAHDFNNLLGGIYGYIDLALELSTDENICEFLERSMSTIERAKTLTGQLLTFSKGGSPVRKTRALSPFIKKTVEFALSGSNVICSFHMEEDLWHCNYDQNQMEQVIDNVIINAQQAMPLGGTINLYAKNIELNENFHNILKKGKYVKISIKDTGIGIPEKVLDKVFDPFFTTKTKGHGLGLTTSYSIMEKHGGTIDIESQPGKGSTVNLYLPASDDSKKTQTDPNYTKHLGKGLFIIMDDEEVIRKMTASIIQSFGYKTQCFENGTQTIDYFKNAKQENIQIDAMIFDLTIPGAMGGKETIQIIRTMDKTIPVFVSSGYSQDPVMDNPNEYGFTASITKPFKKSELAELLNQYL